MNTAKRAFTLVELLVVIGIIALLISILLPALNTARHEANTVKCASNLHQIAQAMLMYAEEYHNNIPGAPVNTGGAWTVDGGGNPGWPTSFNQSGFSPGVNQNWDWQTPILAVLGVAIPFDANANPALNNAWARWERISFEFKYGIFTCPENQAVAVDGNGFASDFPTVTDPGALPYPSYMTGMTFMEIANPLSPVPTTTPTYCGNAYENPPSSYWPRLDKVGKTSEKIFLADGGRYLPYAVGVSFTEDWKVVAEEGGEYADWGADSYYTHAQSRADCAAAIANIPGATLSPIPVRNLWARHGPLKHGVLANEYKFNAVFYDGHVETLGDLQGANPIYWMPKGTVVSAQEFWGDVYKQYDIPSGLYICPE